MSGFAGVEEEQTAEPNLLAAFPQSPGMRKLVEQNKSGPSPVLEVLTRGLYQENKL